MFFMESDGCRRQFYGACPTVLLFAFLRAVYCCRYDKKIAVLNDVLDEVFGLFFYKLLKLFGISILAKLMQAKLSKLLLLTR